MTPRTRSHLHVLRNYADDCAIVAVTAAAEYVVSPDMATYDRLLAALRQYDEASDVWAMACVVAAGEPATVIAHDPFPLNRPEQS